uniref:Uncharacterized protein n=1 Tax=Cacopsylla melanoneura TaxID=428564 RepID=A0A8D8Q629_9HEMI
MLNSAQQRLSSYSEYCWCIILCVPFSSYWSSLQSKFHLLEVGSFPQLFQPPQGHHLPLLQGKTSSVSSSCFPLHWMQQVLLVLEPVQASFLPSFPSSPQQQLPQVLPLSSASYSSAHYLFVASEAPSLS